MRLKTFKAAALTLLLPCAAFAAQPTSTPGNPGRPQLGEPVTPHSISTDIRNLPVAATWKPGQAIREAHKRQYRPLNKANPHAPADKPAAADGLSELQQIFDENAPANARARASNGRVSINNGNTGVSPGDPVVEVGTSHVLYGVNGSSGNGGTTFTIYNKTGTKLAGPTSMKSLAPAGHACATSWSDPIILFDRLANRWFMLEMGGGSSNPHLCTYVSKTSDPVSGGWWFYGFSTPSTPDYPHCGVWNNAYVCGTNEGGANVSVYAFDREKMLAGQTARPVQRFASVPELGGYGFQILTPVSFYGTTDAPAGTKQILARHNDDEAHAGTGANGTKDFIDLYEMTIDWTTPANSGITALPKVDITEFNSWFRDYSTFATVPQPGSTSRIDPIREVLLNQLTYRNFGTHQSIVGTFATNQNAARTGTVVDSGVRWFELRKTGAGGWTLQQEGTFGPGDTSTHHLMGSAAMDKNGNIGLGYNVTKTSTPTVFASLRHTGRKASDPAGVMTLAETDDAVGAAAETSGRWGDYHQMTVDPADDCTFWHVGMYRPSGSWQTKITDFKFDDCGTTGSTFSVSGTITTGSGVGINGVNVSNGSVSTTTNSSGAYTLPNLANGTYTITPSLSGYSFSPTNRSVTVSGANVTGQNFIGTATSNANPVANFTFTTSNLTATFTDSSTDSDGTIASRSWNFGDSATSTTTNPSHTYAAAGTYNVALTVTDNGGATNTITKSVTVTAPPGNVLTNGVSVTGLSATTGNSLNYTMVVPAGATNLKFVISGGTGDADMYVKFGSAPTDTSYDCRPYANGNAETCTISNIQAGTYYVRLKAYSSFSGVSLTGSYTEPCTSNCAQTYSNATDYTISDNATVDSPITVSGRTGNAPSNASVSVNIVHTYQGDLKVDLVAPDGTLYNIHNRTGAGTDNIVKTVTFDLSSEPLNGTWKLRVNDNANADTGYINSWSVTF